MDQQPLYPPQPQFNQAGPQLPQVPIISPPSPPHGHRKWISLSVIISVLIIGIGICVWYFMQPRVQSCLTRADYQTIAGEALPDDAPFSPTIDFYGFDVEFEAGATTFSNPDTESQLVALAQFAKQHPTVSFNVAIQGVYVDSNKSLATDRSAAIKNLLVKSGMNDQTITSGLKTYGQNDPQDEMASEDGDSTLAIAVTSSDTCK